MAMWHAGRRIGPGMDDTRSDSSCGTRPLGAGGSPGKAASGHSWEKQGKRERERKKRGRLVGGPAHRVGPSWRWGGGMTGGPEPGKERKKKKKKTESIQI
jgi:hypothetical protein